MLGVGVKVAAPVLRINQIKILKLSKLKKLTLKLEDQANQAEFLTEYFAGIKKGDFYEEPVQGVYPDW